MELYWILRFPHLHSLLQGLGIILSMIGAAGSFIFCISFYNNRSWEDCDDEFIKNLKICIITTIFCFVINAFIPTKSDLALMYGWDALKSDTVQEVIEILRDKIK